MSYPMYEGEAIEMLDAKFKKQCAKRAKLCRAAAKRFGRTGMFFLAIEQEHEARIWEQLAEHGITLVDD